MKALFLLTIIIFGQFVIANETEANYPLVKGIVRKVDINSGRISIKHEEIPNLNMPGMTMSFLAQDPSLLNGLVAGDKIVFTADEIDGELMVLSLEKAKPLVLGVAKVFCTGVANTSPKTKIEIEIRPDKFSTIRYEHAEGPYIGTAHVNSIGRMSLHKRNGFHIYRAGAGNLDSKLFFKMADNRIAEAFFTNYSSGMSNAHVTCALE